MADGSTKVVYAALAGNVLVAASKYMAAAVSGSSAILTEAIHSTADCTNQLLLLFGNERSRQPPDDSHQFGYSGEIYFWTFVVAITVLLAGGAVSIFEGVLHLLHPKPLTSVRLSLSVLALSTIFEGSSLFVGFFESRRVVASHPVPGEQYSLWRFIKRSKDPNLYESLLEDSAALGGIAIAAAGVVGSADFGLLWADGAASVGIGLLLVAAAAIIADATRRLVAGEAVVSALHADLQSALTRQTGLVVADLRTLHLGPRTIAVMLTLEPNQCGSAATLVEALIGATIALKAVDARVCHVFYEIEAMTTSLPST